MADKAKKSGRPLGRRHQEDVRAKIQASQIINRLNDAFIGKIELSTSQVNIGKTLLDKVLPDLKAIEHSGSEDGAPIKHSVQFNIVDPKEK